MLLANVVLVLKDYQEENLLNYNFPLRKGPRSTLQNIYGG